MAHSSISETKTQVFFFSIQAPSELQTKNNLAKDLGIETFYILANVASITRTVHCFSLKTICSHLICETYGLHRIPLCSLHSKSSAYELVTSFVIAL